MKNALPAIAAILFAASLTGCYATLDGRDRHAGDEGRGRHDENGEHRGDHGNGEHRGDHDRRSDDRR